MATVVDSNVVIGYRLGRDQFHDRASAIVRGLDVGDLPRAVLTDYCLGETLNIVGERAGHGAGVDTLDALVESRGVDIVETTRGDFSTGQAIYRRSANLTFVDAVTVAYMRREGLQYVYSFDDDFDAVEGITRVETPDDPFA